VCVCLSCVCRVSVVCVSCVCRVCVVCVSCVCRVCVVCVSCVCRVRLRVGGDALLVDGVVGVPQQDVGEAGLQQVHGEEGRLLHDLEHTTGDSREPTNERPPRGQPIGSRGAAALLLARLQGK